MTKRPEFVYFDLGNVLLYFDHDLAFRRMAKLAGVTPLEMRSAVMDSELQIEYETGLISGSDFVDRIASHLGRSLETDTILEAAADMFIPNPHILPVLQRVRDLGLPMGLLSNTCEAHWHWIMRMGYPQVRDWFGPVILSFEAKSMKPDSGIYEVAEREAGHSGPSLFFTDDRHDNIQSATQRGWQTEVFINADRLMKIIDKWDI
ncbi:MAG: HAD family hydrolase [Pirellula sp.]